MVGEDIGTAVGIIEGLEIGGVEGLTSGTVDGGTDLIDEGAPLGAFVVAATVANPLG